MAICISSTAENASSNVQPKSSHVLQCPPPLCKHTPHVQPAADGGMLTMMEV